jgi:hypothetical protein
MEMQRGILGRNDLSIKGQRQPILRKKNVCIFSLRFHLKKRKTMKEVRVDIPLYLNQ